MVRQAHHERVEKDFAIVLGNWELVIDYVNREVFDKPADYYTLEKLRKAASNRKEPAGRERHLVECFINKMKHYRRIFSRFEKLDTRYLGFLHFTAALIWLR